MEVDEGSGAVANDSSGNNHQGKILGTPDWIAGHGDTGSALLFTPGVCTGVDTGVYDPTKGTGKFTVALWAFWDGTGTFQHFLTKSNGWGTTTMMFQIECGAPTRQTQHTDWVCISFDRFIEFSSCPRTSGPTWLSCSTASI
jgi:hypothetical protein